MPLRHQRLFVITALLGFLITGFLMWSVNRFSEWAWRIAPMGLCAPLFVATVLEFRRQRPIWQQLVPEGLALLGAATPLLNGYAVLIILVLLNVLPRLGPNPPPTDDALFRTPNDWITVLLLVVVGFSTWEIWLRRGGWGRMAERLTVSTRRLTLLLALCAVVLLAWPLANFTGALLFSGAALLWPWIEPRRLPAGRALNAMLVLGGGLPFAGAAVALGLEVGPFWWWFGLMAAAYGVYSLSLTLAFIVAVAIGARFLRMGAFPPAGSLSHS